MPYIIVVIVLVVASVGFTFFQSSHTSVSNTPSQTLAVEVQKEADDIPTDNGTFPNPETNSSTSAPTKDTTPVEEPTPHPAKTPPSPSPVPTPSPATVPVNTNTYKNGTYSTKAFYRTPDGQYQMTVNLSVLDDEITDTTVSWSTGGGDGYSKTFARSYQSTVVGKDLGTVHLSRIGGASLTTKAFNNTLDTIRSQAT